jgi:hypothetical protein
MNTTQEKSWFDRWYSRVDDWCDERFLIDPLWSLLVTVVSIPFAVWIVFSDLLRGKPLPYNGDNHHGSPW